MSLVNRGMGGSLLAQQIYYFDRLVVPHAPKVVAFYCANDVDNETTEYVWELIRYYEYKIHTAWPNTVFCIASMNPSISSQAIIDSKIKPVNTILSDWAAYRPNTEFINSFAVLMNANGTLNTSLFRVDGLHLNSTGYQLIKPVYKIKINDVLHKIKGYPVMRITGF
jgi:lysophospholipase L1-like esterase